MKPFIIVSGIKDINQARQLAAMGVTGIGLIFHGENALHPEQAREIALEMPPLVSKIGFFKDEPWYNVSEIASLCKLEVLAFEGSEDKAYTNKFSEHILTYQTSLEGDKRGYIVLDIANNDQEADLERVILRCKPDPDQFRQALNLVPYGIELRMNCANDFSKLVSLL